ncbi:MAG: DUF255 domain-containing protein [Pedosphaera sp.]|nr:DUF255 domain-containing protein [Pedosphaera sp.]
MKTLALTLMIGLVALQTALAASAKKDEADWLTSLPKALEQAKADNKVVMLDFTGSDWCPPCMKLKKEVFIKPEFAEYAARNLILVEVDFPQRKRLSKAQQAANDALAVKYNTSGMIPTIVLMNKDQKVLGNVGYTPGGPKAFIAELEKILKKK